MEAVNPKRRAEKVFMAMKGFKSKKAFRKWQKRQRRVAKEASDEQVN